MSPSEAIDAMKANGVSDGPLTVSGVPALRSKTQVPKGVAAASDSDMFKSLVRLPLYSPCCLSRLAPTHDSCCLGR